MIRINGLDKYYNKGKKNEQHVLNNISLEFPKTGLICILGESGSGKTTLLNTVGGIDTFSKGSIEIDGTKIDKYKPKVIEPLRNDKFDYIFQNYYLLKDHSVAYNVKIALNRYNISEEEKNQRVDYVLNMLGMERFRKKDVSKLSGGQQQRVSIARALVKSPDVIFADEPTGNLDEENTLRTMSILKNISKECLVLLVTHEKRIAKFFADRIIEVRDGKIVRDEKNKASKSYERSDDSNIYLKEMEASETKGEKLNIHSYKAAHEIDKKIDLTFAWKNGKLYIKNNMNCDLLIEGIENGIEMIDDYPPSLEIEDVEELSYELPKLKSKGSSKLSFKEILHMSLENIQMMGKKQGFIAAILLITAILLSMTVAQFINAFSIDEKSVISTDTHYAQITFENNAGFGSDITANERLNFINEIVSDKNYGEATYVPKVNIYLTGAGYEQLDNLTQQIDYNSFVDINHLKGQELLFGKMPKIRTDIVIDKQLVEKLATYRSAVASLHDSIESYIGTYIYVGTLNLKLKIVGICNTDEPSIFCSQNLLTSLTYPGYSIANAEELNAISSNQYKDLKLEDNQVLLSEHIKLSSYKYKNEMYFGDAKETKFQIVGTIPDEIGIDYILSDKGCEHVRNLMILQTQSVLFYTNDTQKVMNYFKENAPKSKVGFDISMNIPSKDQIEAYKSEHSANIDIRTLIPIAIAILSLVMVYFSIKSNVSSRIEELTVYRLIGISKNSILKTYILEMFFLTSYTSLPAILISSAIISFVSAIPSIDIGMSMPPHAPVILILAVYLIHSLISIIPVANVLSKPPATLAVKN